MLFRIDGPPDGGEIPEYGLIELQGRIEQQHEVAPGEPVPVGTVVLSKTDPGVVRITIGYHEIEGKRIALKRPLAILERQPQAAGAAAVDEEAAAPSSSDAFAVIGVVRHRFLFKGRPRALITKPGEARQTMAAKHRQERREEAAAAAAAAGGGAGEPPAGAAAAAAAAAAAPQPVPG